jgi:hypothetical protein
MLPVIGLCLQHKILIILNISGLLQTELEILELFALVAFKHLVTITTYSIRQSMESVAEVQSGLLMEVSMALSLKHLALLVLF